MEAIGYGTVNGVPITDDVIDQLVTNAETGFPGVTARRAVGRPATGGDSETTVSVRLDSDLYLALVERACDTDANVPHLVREVLRKFLGAA